ncbi:phage/plasmid primase, P4 family [Microvirga pakistanensis]|uniref:phage/plasmid primase, P4 family n=1 Tax=Microvirga pakistanensis TaxID=1682650 RepID=UPI00106CC817|nr:phage/plasmid primase, P4 family [Microvirga pakistanensis]
MKENKNLAAEQRGEHDDLRIRFSIGNSNLGRAQTRKEPWGVFRQRLVKERRDTQTSSQYLALSSRQKIKPKGRHGFFVSGPCADDIRSAETVEDCYVLSLDFDGMSQRAFDLLLTVGALPGGDYEAVWSTTRSHRSDDIRVRIVILLARPVNRHEYRALVAILANKMGLAAHGLDPASAEPERAMFWSSVCSDGEFYAGHICGALLDPDDLLSDYWNAEGEIERDRLPSIPGKAEDNRSKALSDRGVDLDDDLNFLASAESQRPLGLTQEVLRSAVMAIPNDGSAPDHKDRAWWLRVLAAIHHETSGSDEGRALAHEWSKRWSGYHAANTNHAWDSFRGRAGRQPITARYIQKLARLSGWQPPAEKARAELGVYGELWYGKSFAKRYQGKLIYIPQLQQWYGWAGANWTSVSIPEIEQFANIVVEEELVAAHERYRAEPSDSNKALARKAERFYESLSKVRNIIGAAMSVPGMWASINEFDRDPMLLGVRNGVVDLRTGQFLEPHPSQHISKQAGAVFDPDADCPKWRRFLQTVQPDSAIRSFLQRAIGYTLTGLVDEERWFFLYGKGANGKSVFANILAELLGDYAVTLGSPLVTKNKHENEAERLKARLPGKRIALVNEVAQGDIWDDQRMKEMNSREKMSARFLQKEAFDFMPTHTLWVRGNYLPGVTDAGHGFWRRIVPILFPRQLEAHEIIPDLDRQIIAQELPGVLNWAIEGALQWQRDGLRIPTAIKATTAEYQADTDLIGLWLEECCEADGAARTTIADAFESYRQFCASQGVAYGSKMSFSRILKARGFTPDPSRKRGRAFFGFLLQRNVTGEGAFL